MDIAKQFSLEGKVALITGAAYGMVPFMKEKQIGLVNFNSLAGGLLTGKYHSDQPEEETRYYKTPTIKSATGARTISTPLKRSKT